MPLAIAVRQPLIEVSSGRQLHQGQQTKMELVYQYLSGSRFRQRIDAIVEKFTDMRDDLEPRAQGTKLWARRQEQLNGVLDSTAGLCGDRQGIAGRAMPEIEGLDVLVIEGATPGVTGWRSKDSFV
jgi:hypothetical protein